MKKILILLTAVFALSSCNDMLTVQSPDKLTSDVYWRDATDAENGLAAVYSQLECTYDVWEFTEVKWPVEAFREDIVDPGSDALNYQNWVELHTFAYNNGNSQFSLYWKHQYMGLSYANQAIEKISEIGSGITEAQKNQFIAEAKFLRAYYLMKLLLNWEKIVVHDKFITSPSDLNKALSERVPTWEFICKNLEESAPYLPAQYPAQNIGRATSGAAYSYLGFAYLTRGWEESNSAHFTKAVESFDKVTGYSLVKDIISMFDGTNKNSAESIFELQFTDNTENGASYRTAINKWMAVSELDGWDEILPSKMLMEEFFKEGQIATTGLYDSRLYHTIFYQCDYFNDETEGRVYNYTYDEWFCDENGNAYNKPAFRKYLPRTWDLMRLSRTGLNVPLMRYSNVLLMKAEALNELGRTSEAIPLINQVRQRADMPNMTGSSKAEVMAQIEHERIIEFALENFRFYDLRRWGKTKDALHAIGRTSFDPSKHNFYPIPFIEIQSNSEIN